MGKPYLYERQTEYWTSRGVEDYFLDAGYEVITFPLSQFAEYKIPFDFLFFEKTTCKLFGLQYKTLYKNEHDYWPLNEQQHRALQAFSIWGYYCFSQMKDSKDHRVAIHKAMFIPVTMKYCEKIHAGHIDAMYYRWGGFVNGLEICTVGKRVTSREEIVAALRPIERDTIVEVDQNVVDVFAANINLKKIIHFDSRA